MNRCFSSIRAVFRTALPVMALSLLFATAAMASHVTIDCTSPDLTDLKAAIQANWGPNAGGFAVDSVASATPGSLALGDANMQTRNTWLANCGFVNGFDMVHAYVLLDFLNSGGAYSGNSTLYAGWEVTGIVGDTDGNGSPNTGGTLHCNPPTVISDFSGISSTEDYIATATLCDGTELDFIISANAVTVQKDGNPISIPAGASAGFAWSSTTPFGHTLKLCVSDLEAFLAPGQTLNGASFALHSDARNDILGEDVTTAPMVVDLPPAINITDVPASQSVCPGSNLGYTVTITNPGPDILGPLSVKDDLGPGLSWVSDDQGGVVSNGGHHIEWTFPGPLAVNGTIVIHVTAVAAFPCASPNLPDAITVNAIAACSPGNASATASANFTVACASPPCTITPPTAAICVGGTPAHLCGPAGLTYAWDGPGGFTATTQCIDVSVAGNYRLITANATGCKDTCNATLTVNPPPTCDITPATAAICVGGTPAHFCGPAGLQYAWTGPGGFTASTQCIDVSVAGDYFLTTTDAATGCVSSPACKATLTVNPLPPCDITPATASICSGATPAHFCGPAGLQYAWTGPGGFTASTQCIDVSVAGDYFLTTTNAATGCVSSPACKATLTVTPVPPCTITPGDVTVCNGASQIFCGPAATGTLAGMTFAWTGPGGFTAASQCITVSAVGTYTLVTTLNGCPSVGPCQVNLSNKTCVVNCPRTPGYWMAQCDQKGNGSTKYSKTNVDLIAQCVDAHSTFFNWGTSNFAAFNGFCAVEHATAGLYNETRRHFAALLANACTGLLGIPDKTGAQVFLDLTTPINCSGAKTVGDLVQRVDSLLIAIGTGTPTASQKALMSILEPCEDAINNGLGIGPICSGGGAPSVVIYSGDGTASGTSGSGLSGTDRGTAGLDGSLQPGAQMPVEFALHANVPNPFTHLTSIRFALPVASHVKLAIYDVSGRQVNVVTDDSYAAGEHSISWSGVDRAGHALPGGAYFCRMQAISTSGRLFDRSIRMTLAR